MHKVLITGGIGSGKSTACKMFEELGVPVLYSDKVAKSIMDSDKDVISKIKNLFGDDIYNDGELDRKDLAEVVFNDVDSLLKLNEIVHPAVADAFESFVGVNETFKESEYVIEEAAIGIETGVYKKFDTVVLVTADEDVRIKRVMDRDKCTEQQVRDRMSYQMSDEAKKKLSDYVIINNDFPNLECQVKAIHDKILESIKK
jgi:dephospho-CoA kinase